MLRAESVPLACSLEKEPGSSLGFVDPNFDQTRGRNVSMFVANVVRLAQARSQCLIVVCQLSKHVRRLDVFRIIVGDPLITRNLTNRVQSNTTNLSNSLCDGVGHREQLLGVFVEQQ